ncbi:hypothetical protein FLAN108750_04630 [Flavobacterium antarcticum]
MREYIRGSPLIEKIFRRTHWYELFNTRRTQVEQVQ